jgi:hypothetical protein
MRKKHERTSCMGLVQLIRSRFRQRLLVLVLVALVASYIGARRAAAGVDPMIALGLCRAKDGGDSGIEEGSFRYC